MAHTIRIYWDQHTDDGYAYSRRPHPDPADGSFADYDSGAAGPQMDPARRGTEAALVEAAREMDLDPAKAAEWHPGMDGGWAEWIIYDTLTTRQAAELAGMSTSSFRRLAHRARQVGVELQAPREQWPDERSPRYDRQALEDYLAGRRR